MIEFGLADSMGNGIALSEKALIAIAKHQGIEDKLEKIHQYRFRGRFD